MYKVTTACAPVFLNSLVMKNEAVCCKRLLCVVGFLDPQQELPAQPLQQAIVNVCTIQDCIQVSKMVAATFLIHEETLTRSFIVTRSNINRFSKTSYCQISKKTFSQLYSTPLVKKTRHQTLSHNFTNYYPIFKIFSLSDSVGNLQQTGV